MRLFLTDEQPSGQDGFGTIVRSCGVNSSASAPSVQLDGIQIHEDNNSSDLLELDTSMLNQLQCEDNPLQCSRRRS